MTQHIDHSPIALSDLRDYETFLKHRPKEVQEIIALKADRRLALGAQMTVLFENRRLVLWQIQEMLRVEKGGKEQAQEEIKVYAPLVPGPSYLTITLMIEIPDPEQRKKVLAQLAGLEKFIFLTLGTHQIPAQAIHTQHYQDLGHQPTSTVHFLAFHLDEDQKRDFQNQQPSILCTHSDYAYNQKIPTTLWEALKEERL
jgi:hypothetical protein